MNSLELWTNTILSSFTSLWEKFFSVIPNILAAIVILLVGWAVAEALGRLVTKLIKMVWLEKALEKIKIHEFFKKMNIDFSFSRLIGWLVKWFLIIVVLIATADVLNLEEVTGFLNQVVLYIPNVVVAVVILVLGLLVGNFVKEVVKQGLSSTGLRTTNTVAGIAKWAIVVFSFMAALVQLGIAADLIRILFTGFVAMVALAGGLAFGLGGKEEASRILSNLKKDIGHDN